MGITKHQNHDSNSIKKELIKAIDSIYDANFLQAVYTIVNEKSREDEYELSAEQWSEIENRRKDYKGGKSKTYTWEETKKMMRTTLKK